MYPFYWFNVHHRLTIIALLIRYSITIWSGCEPASSDDLLEFYNGFEPDQVFFDVPSELLTELKQKIEDQNNQ